MVRGTKLHVFSDIYNLDNIVQHVGILHGRNLLIDILRETFSRDREYHFVRDIYGFPKTPAHQGLDTNAGIENEDTTRIFIGSAYRYDISFLPAIVIRQTSTSYVPISFNQNKWVTEFAKQRIVDGYGNATIARLPSHYAYAGAWNQTFEIKVLSKSLEDTISIADIVMISLQATYRQVLQQNGLFIKNVSAGGESAEVIGANDPIFALSITANTRSEWRRHIPVSSLVDRIQFCFNVDLTSADVPATDLDIKTSLSLT